MLCSSALPLVVAMLSCHSDELAGGDVDPIRTGEGQSGSQICTRA